MNPPYEIRDMLLKACFTDATARYYVALFASITARRNRVKRLYLSSRQADIWRVMRKGARVATQTVSETTIETMRRRFTVAEYQRMGEVGIFTEDERIELIAGEMYQMSPIGARHVACVIALDELLHNMVGRDAVVSVQNPIQMQDDTMPQPDLTVLRRRSYISSLPTIADILLVIEVSDSTLAYDRGTKLPLYAAAGIAEAWIVDLAATTVERHTDPRDGQYRLIASARPGESLASTVLPALAIPVADILK